MRYTKNDLQNIIVIISTFLKTISGADTLVYLALLPPNTTDPKGTFIAERKEVPFKAPDLPMS